MCFRLLSVFHDCLSELLSDLSGGAKTVEANVDLEDRLAERTHDHLFLYSRLSGELHPVP